MTIPSEGDKRSINTPLSTIHERKYGKYSNVCETRLKPGRAISLSISATVIGTTVPAIIFISAIESVFQKTWPMLGMLNI